MKFLSAAVVLAALTSLVHAGQLISVQRCRDGTCTSNCTTVMEIQGDQCHTQGAVFKHGEMLHCAAAPQKQCFRETLYDAKGGLDCNGPVIFSAPRECDVCTEDPFGKFFKYSGCGTSNMVVKRGCDFGCYTCEVIIPINENTCTTYKDVAINVGSPKACDADITAYHFRNPFCDGEPEFKHAVFTGECYNVFGVGHRFQCA